MIFAHLAPDHLNDAVDKLRFWPTTKDGHRIVLGCGGLDLSGGDDY